MPPPKESRVDSSIQWYGIIVWMFYQNLYCYYGTYYYTNQKNKNKIWIKECQKAWELIKQKYIKAPILISPNWQVEFHVHTNATLLAIGTNMLSHNLKGKSDQPVVYVSRQLKQHN
jgi:hypothetical protein